MGSTGGGYFSGSVSAAELANRIRQAEDRARDQTFETSVNEYLGSLLSRFNDRNAAGTQEILEQIVSELEGEIEGTVNTLFGGSVAKRTYLEGISDVDALVLVDNTELKETGPEEVKGYLASCLAARYGREAVNKGVRAVTVIVDDKMIQLLPALRVGEGLRIANSEGTEWSRVNPGRFAAALTRANEAMNSKLVPCIKLVKAIVAELPEKRQMTGYHVESMAIQVFREYEGLRTNKAMLGHFFEKAASGVNSPIVDSSGQSVHVDEDLGPKGSLQRRILGDALGRIGRKIRNADGAQSMARWRELFE